MAAEEGGLFAEAVRDQGLEQDRVAASQHARDEAHRTFDARFDQIKVDFLEAAKAREGRPFYSGTAGTSICARGWRLPGGRSICFQSYDDSFGSARPRRNARYEPALAETGEVWLVVHDDHGRTIGRKPAWGAGGDRVYVGPVGSGTAGYRAVDPHFGVRDEQFLAGLLRDVARSLARGLT